MEAAQKIAVRPQSAVSLRRAIPWLAPDFFVITTIIGAVRWFSPVPFWDMWDGTLGFNLAIRAGRWSEFFSQANEHRIVLSKILFLIDYRLFGGLSYFLIACNIALMLAIWITLAAVAHRITHRNTARLLACLSGVLVFSWLQSENINWGYQSQFYMAYLLPLLAMLMMARFISTRGQGWFYLAAVIGAASALTMANGLSALPIMVVMLAVSGREFRKDSVVLVGITILVIALYFTNYEKQPHELATIRQIIAFILTFLGAPFAYVFQCQPLTFLMGAAVAAAAAFCALRITFDRNRDPVALALAAFILHACAAGAAAAIGRANLGLGAATAGRYETPVLILYASLAIMFAHLWRHRAETNGAVATATAAFFVGFFAFQLNAFSPEGPRIAQQRDLGVLALSVGANDDARLAKLYPVDTPNQKRNLWETTRAAMDANLSVFSRPPFRTVHAAIGNAPPAGFSQCQGSIDIRTSIPGDKGFERIDGWAFTTARRVPRDVLLVENGIVVGAALTGFERMDVARAIDPAAAKSGFQGYVKIGAKPQIFCGN